MSSLIPGNTSLKEKELLTEEKYRECLDQFGIQSFKVGIGAEAIRELLRKVDVEALWNERDTKMKGSVSSAVNKKLTKRPESH